MTSAPAATMRVVLAVEALVALVVGTVLRRLVSLRRLGPLLGVVGPVSGGPAVRPDDGDRVARVRWALAAATRRVPWRPSCVAEALAAALLLRRRGVGYRVVIGVRRSEDRGARGMAAHAWVESGGVVVAGSAGHTAFVPLHEYGRPAR